MFLRSLNGPVCYSAPPHAGYKVATTCSSRNFTLVTALGANAVFDYHGPLTEVVRSIKAAAGDTIRSAIDCISIKESQQISQDVIAPGGGKVAVLLPKVEIDERPDVQRICECHTVTLKPRTWGLIFDTFTNSKQSSCCTPCSGGHSR